MSSGLLANPPAVGKHPEWITEHHGEVPAGRDKHVCCLWKRGQRVPFSAKPKREARGEKPPPPCALAPTGARPQHDQAAGPSRAPRARLPLSRVPRTLHASCGARKHAKCCRVSDVQRPRRTDAPGNLRRFAASLQSPRQRGRQSRPSIPPPTCPVCSRLRRSPRGVIPLPPHLITERAAFLPTVGHVPRQVLRGR